MQAVWITDDLSWLTENLLFISRDSKTSTNLSSGSSRKYASVCIAAMPEFSIPEGQLLVLSIANAAVTDSTAANSVGSGRSAELSSSDSPRPADRQALRTEQ